MTDGYGEDRLLSLADGALRLPGVDGVEVVLTRTHRALTRFAESRIHQNVARADGEARVRVVVDGDRVGTVATNQLTPDAVRTAAEQAREAAHVTPRDRGWPGLAGPSSYPDGSVVDERTASADPALRADVVARMLAELPRGVYGAGYAETSAGELAVTNTAGVRAYARSTRAGASVLANGSDSTGYAQDAGARVGDLDPEQLGNRAADKVARGAHPREVPAGTYAVVLEPGAVVEAMEWLGWTAFGGKAVHEGRSPLSGHLGEQVCSPLVTIVDDATSPLLPGVPFDFEGTPKRRLPLIERGVAVGVAHDRASAALAGADGSTGNALPAPNSEGGLPMHLLMEPGEATSDELVAGLERGLYVTRFHYTNLVHPVTSTITGMTRDGTFLVTDGHLVGGVRNLRFTQSVLGALSTVEAVGDTTETGGGMFFGGARAPALRLSAFTFTSTTAY